MEVDESGDQEMASEAEMRIVTQDTPNHLAPRFSSVNEPNQSQKKKKIRTDQDNNNYGQDTTEHTDQPMSTYDTPTEGGRNYGEIGTANLAEDTRKDKDQSPKTGQNTYITTNLFQQARSEAEQRRAQNNMDNQDATSLLIKFSVRGWHEVKPFSNDIALYKAVIMAIWEKAKQIDESPTIHPWNEDLVPIRQHRDIDELIEEKNRNNYLYAPNVRRGNAVFGRDLKDGINKSFAIRLSKGKHEPIDDKFIKMWNKTDEGVNNWLSVSLEKENGRVYEITIMEIEKRPIQDKKMEEIGYIYGSINGQDTSDIIKGMQNEVNERLSYHVTLGCRWTQPDLGPETDKLWKEASTFEGKERSLRSPLIQVIYANEDDTTRLRDISGILHDNYGEHEKIETSTGMDYELPTLPDGSKGLFIRAYRLTRNRREKENTSTMIKYHIQMKAACSKWIRTNIIDTTKIVQYKGEIYTIKEYMLSRKIAPGVFYYHQMVTRMDLYGRQVTYLVCNSAYGQSATQKYQELVSDLIDDDLDADEAFEDVSIGAVSAITKEGTVNKQPSELANDRYSVSLSRMIAIERSRIDNVFIDGVQIKEISIPGKTNIFHRRPKRNITIQENENQEEVEQDDMSTDQDMLQQGMNMTQNEILHNNDNNTQEWQQVKGKNATKSRENSSNVNVTINNHGDGNNNDVSNNIFREDEQNQVANSNNSRNTQNTESLTTRHPPSILRNTRPHSDDRGGRGGRGARTRSNLQQTLRTTQNLDEPNGENSTKFNNV